MSTDRAIGSVICVGGYSIKLVKILAQGGFGVVFYALDVNNKTKYAVKRLITSTVNKPAADKEILFSRQFPSTPNIVHFVGSTQLKVDNWNTHVFMVTELCSGGTLLDALNARGRLSVGDIAYIFVRMLRAVNALHSSSPPVIHRDLKVENFLISEEGEIKLCDFGSATNEVYDVEDWSVEQITRLEEEIRQCTTLSYRAPEMVDLYMGYTLGLGQDIWALGCVLYCLCFRQHPFADLSTLAIVQAAYHLPPTSDTSLRPLALLIEHILVVDPQYRPSVHQIMNHFEQLTTQCSIDLTRPPAFLNTKDVPQTHFMDDLVRPPRPTHLLEKKFVTSRLMTLLTHDMSKQSMSQCEQIINELKTSGDVVFVNFPTTPHKLTNIADITWNRRTGESLHSTLTTLSQVYKRMTCSPTVKCVVCGIIGDSSLHFFLCGLLLYCRLFESVEACEEYVSTKKGSVCMNNLKKGLLHYLALVILDASSLSVHYDWILSRIVVKQSKNDMCARLWVEDRQVIPTDDSYAPVHDLCPQITLRGNITLQLFSLLRSGQMSHMLSLSFDTAQLRGDNTFHHFDSTHFTVHKPIDDLGVVLNMSPVDPGLSFIDSRWGDLSVASLFPSVLTASHNEIVLISHQFNISQYATTLINGVPPDEPPFLSPPECVVQPEVTVEHVPTDDLLSFGDDLIKQDDFISFEPPSTPHAPKMSHQESFLINFEEESSPINPTFPTTNQRLGEEYNNLTFPTINPNQPQTSPEQSTGSQQCRPNVEKPQDRTKNTLKTIRELKESNIELQNPIGRRVAQWTKGKGKNIRYLLSSLRDVLWDGAPWTTVSIGQLLLGDDVKRYYRRAALLVHPDKTKGSPFEELAALIFVELSEAWGVFCASGMKDMY